MPIQYKETVDRITTAAAALDAKIESAIKAKNFETSPGLMIEVAADLKKQGSLVTVAGNTANGVEKNVKDAADLMRG